jgi:CelD/BcsL family acetyltransferase involved in cellulose biosynthesis
VISTFQIQSPLDLPDWNARLTPSSGESVFNTVEWARVLHETYGYTPCYLTTDEGSRSILLPMMEVDSWLTGRRGVSLPFSDLCEPIGLDRENSEQVIGELKGFGRSRKWRYFEVRNDRAASEEIPRSLRYLTHTLDLTSSEENRFGRLESSVRTSIRKAAKAGVKVTFSESLDSVREFYRLNCETRRRHGLPPQPFRFFRNVHQHVLQKGLGRVVTAWHGGCVIAAAVFFYTGRQVLYKYGASDAAQQHLRASNLLMWEAIRHYAARGYERLSLGRTAKSHTGLRRFKLGWGAQEGEIGYIKYDLQRGGFDAERSTDSESGHGIVRHLPLWVLRWGGAVLYRHMA